MNIGSSKYRESIYIYSIVKFIWIFNTYVGKVVLVKFNFRKRGSRKLTQNLSMKIISSVEKYHKFLLSGIRLGLKSSGPFTSTRGSAITPQITANTHRRKMRSRGLDENRSTFPACRPRKQRNVAEHVPSRPSGSKCTGVS